MSNLTVFPSSAVSAHHWTSKSCSSSLLFRHRTFWRIWEDNPQPQYVIFILTFSTKANLCYVPPVFPTPPFPWTKSPNISGTTCCADFLKEIIFRFRDYKSLLFWHFLCFIQIICQNINKFTVCRFNPPWNILRSVPDLLCDWSSRYLPMSWYYVPPLDGVDLYFLARIG